MSRPDQVEFLLDSITSLDPIGGGPYGRQLRVSGHMNSAQVRDAARELLGGMKKPDAYLFIRGEFPELFPNEATA